MSQKECKHNDHSHWMIWYFIGVIWMWSIMDCSGDNARFKHDISFDEHEISVLKFDVSRLESKVNDQAREISSLKSEVQSLQRK